MVQCNEKWLTVDNSQAVLIEMLNKWSTNGDPLYRIGFRCWLVMPQCKTEAEWNSAIAAKIKSEGEVKIMWPLNCNVKSAKETLKLLTCTKSSPVEFEATVVKILAYGDISLMKTKLKNKVEFGKTTPTKEDRRVTARKNKMQNENEKVPQKQSKKQVNTIKAKSAPSKRSDEEKQVLLGKLKAAKAARRALSEIKVNEATKHVQLSDAEPNIIDDGAASAATENSPDYDVSGVKERSKKKVDERSAEHNEEIFLPQSNSVSKSQASVINGNKKLAKGRRRILSSGDDEDAIEAGPLAEELIGKVVCDDADLILDSERSGDSKEAEVDDEDAIEASSPVKKLIGKVVDDGADLLVDSEESGYNEDTEEPDDDEVTSYTTTIDNETEQMHVDALVTVRVAQGSTIEDPSESAANSVEATSPIRKESSSNGKGKKTSNISDVDGAADPPSPSSVFESRETDQQDESSGSIQEDQVQIVANLGREELLELLQRKDEELKEKDRLVLFWKSKCLKMQERAKRCETELRPIIMDADDVANQLSEQSNSSLDLADEAARFSGKGIDQSGSRGKKRKRGHSEKVLALSKKRRTIFPLPTTWKLSEKIETICSNRGLKTVRKVANEAIPELFTQEELASCCPMGTKKSDRKRSNPDAADRSNSDAADRSNPHSANRPGRPPLDAERLNALINRCWTRFSKDPNWYDDFKEALKYQMRLARKNILEEA